MASSQWEKRLRPKFPVAVSHTAEMIEDGTILDILFAKNVLTSCQHEKLRSSSSKEAARSLLLNLKIGTKFDAFLAILPEVEGAKELHRELTEGQASSRSDSDSDSDQDVQTILTVSVLKKYEHVYKRHRHSFRSAIKKAFPEVRHKRVRVDETYPKKVCKSDSAHSDFAITETVVFKIVFPNIRNRQVLEPHCQRIVRELAGVMDIREDQVEIFVSDRSCILSITVTVPGNGFICFMAALDAPSNLDFLCTVDDKVIVRIDGLIEIFLGHLYDSTQEVDKRPSCK